MCQETLTRLHADICLREVGITVNPDQQASLQAYAANVRPGAC